MSKALGILLVVLLVIGGCGAMSYNNLVQGDVRVDEQWSNVQSQYKRRSDLIPQLVEVVKGAADFEKSTITEVTEMRASVGQMKLPEGGPENEAQLEAYLGAQDALGKSLGRLLLVAENYPQLRATESFRDLQSQLEGTENRIATARTDYIGAIAAFNRSVRSFPNNFLAGMFGFEPKPNLEFESSVEDVPEINFGEER